MPLLIYGADIPIDEDFTLDKFLDDSIVDETSWAEFMPSGVTRDVFKQFMKYYDQDIFVAAGRKIRNTVVGADDLAPTERVQQIARLFACFKNPDKETVLTPFRVVNMHLSDCLGGYSFYEENPPVNATMLEQPRFVDRGQVTADTLANTQAQILEINAKTGLYPLYVVYSIFRARCDEYAEEELTLEKQNELWAKTVQENIFVICKTPMAKFITKRTLVGYRNISINAHYFDDLINTMQNKQRQFVDRVLKPSYWHRSGDLMKFDAVVGNPPYQVMDGGAKSSASPIYNYFVSQAQKIEPSYVSMIMPAKWYSGGKGLDTFRAAMLSDRKMQRLIDYTNSLDVFPSVDIAGGVCYFLWNTHHNDVCHFVNFSSGKMTETEKYLDEFSTLIRYPLADTIIHKVVNMGGSMLDSMVSTRKPFGLATNAKPTNTGDITLRYNGGTGHYKRELITVGVDNIDKWKVMISYLSAEHAGQPDKNGMFKILSTMEILPPKFICTETYLIAGSFDTEVEANNFYDYLKSKFVRFLIAQVVYSIIDI